MNSKKKNAVNTAIQLICFICSSVIAQTKTIVSGKISNPKNQTISVSYYEIGEEKTINGKINVKGFFKIIINEEKASSYFLTHGDERTTMYLFPGDSVFVTLDTKKFDESVNYSGKGALQNNFLAKQYLYFEKGIASNEFEENYSNKIAYSEPDIYEKFIDSVMNLKLNYLTKFKESLPIKFYDYLYAEEVFRYTNEKIDYPFLHYYLRGIMDSTATVNENYYNFYNILDIKNQNYLASTYFETYLDKFIRYKAKKKLSRDSTSSIERIHLSKELLTGLIKENYIANELIYILEYETVDVINKYFLIERNGIKDSALLYKINEKYKQISKLFPGNMAPNFTLKSSKGNVVSLNNFKGKVVYIDFWASWCGPCKLEIPHTKKLQDSLSNKEIVFLYISIDEDSKAWIETISKEKLEGIHLRVNGWNDSVAKDYAIKGVPSYFIIGRNGKIFNKNASRPSHKNVYLELEKALIEKL